MRVVLILLAGLIELRVDLASLRIALAAKC